MKEIKSTKIDDQCENYFPGRPVNGKKEQYMWTNYQSLSLNK